MTEKPEDSESLPKTLADLVLKVQTHSDTRFGLAEVNGDPCICVDNGPGGVIAIPLDIFQGLVQFFADQCLPQDEEYYQ